eukprot:TRINITY_DN9386_c0_g1_i1.p2 TRINITY_DN9386_c0_g1~~TRINITY_DN9386_c0_g1_i1.p2  ORF type:complete len:157 (-),score=11.90 TRINITY_DN9386_c0_g1_i1:431-901(-)
MQIGIVHRLIDVSLTSLLKSAETNAIEEQYARNAVQILHYLANIGTPAVYIPGETTNQARDRKRFMLWGGMATLIFLNHNSKFNELSNTCESASIKNLKLKLHEDLVRVIKVYLENKSNEVQSREADGKGLVNSSENMPKSINAEEIQLQDVAFPE